LHNNKQLLFNTVQLLECLTNVDHLFPFVKNRYFVKSIHLCDHFRILFV